VVAWLALAALADVDAVVEAVALVVLAALVSVAGIFDLWIDFRRLRPSNPDPQKLSNLW